MDGNLSMANDIVNAKEHDGEPVATRTIGLYQPFASLMLHGKIETRWIREGKKPPFPKGKYLFYSTQKRCDDSTLLSWSGSEKAALIYELMQHEPTVKLGGYAIGIGNLVDVRLLLPNDANTFIKFVGKKTELIKDEQVTKVQWALFFENVQRIEPFIWVHGKQGVGYVPPIELPKIKIQ